MIETDSIVFEKGWALKGGNILSEYKTRKIARAIKKINDSFGDSEKLTIYKYFKIIHKESGAITIVMTKSS